MVKEKLRFLVPGEFINYNYEIYQVVAILKNNYRVLNLNTGKTRIIPLYKCYYPESVVYKPVKRKV